ncbi:formin-like protein 18 isoform X2 [Mangifera indica]|uniref:formin-like protein 18 isoform X2 n=1 Tax=Mangifera indica TaxID=29780 RepID=UPI001CF9E9FC|nr:formin-like protein 18 isoform X2 [Mangifera indica]
MALFKKFFYRKPPDGLLEISERVYVFDCCFTMDILEDEEYKVYMGGIVGKLRDHFPDASFMVFNFREGENQSQISNILSEYDMIVMDYPRQYEGCPLLPMEMMHHFLRSSENWLSLRQQNVLLMHCERGGWPVLAFMLAALLIYRKQFTGETKTLDMIYKQAPRGLVQLMSPLNPLPSQLRYLQYVSRRNVTSKWPPLDRALTLDCIIFRVIPSLDGEGGFCPIFRTYGQDPLMVADQTPKVLFSTPKKSKVVRHYKQVLFLEMDATSSLVSYDLPGVEEKDGLPIEAFAKVQEIFNNVDWLDLKADFALSMLQHVTLSSILQEKLDNGLSQSQIKGNGFLELALEKVVEKPKLKASESNIKSPRSIAQAKQSTPPYKPSLDINSPSKKIEAQEHHITLQRPTKSKIISQPLSQTSLSHSTSFGNSLQGSPVSISKYHSAPANLGITTLLQDHDVSDNEEVPYQVTRPLPTATISSPSVTNILKPLQLSHVPTSPQSPPKLPPSLQSSLEAHKTIKNVAPPPSQPSPKETQSLPSQLSRSTSQLPGSTSQSKEHSLSVPSTPPPVLSTLEASSSVTKSSHSTPPPSSLLGASQPLMAEHSLSTLLPPSYSPPFVSTSMSVSSVNNTVSKPPPPPPPPLLSRTSPSSIVKDSLPTLSPPPLPPFFPGPFSTPPPPPPHPVISSASCVASSPDSRKSLAVTLKPPPPPPFPLKSEGSVITSSTPPPPPPPPPLKSRSSITTPAPPPPPPNKSTNVPPMPPALAPLSKASGVSPQSHFEISNGNIPPIPGPPSAPVFCAKGRGISRSNPKSQSQPRKNNLKPYHWLKLTRAMQGSLWAEAQKLDEASKAPEFDMTELESLFSAAAPNSDSGGKGRKSNRCSSGPKSEKVQLVELRRAYNCEIMLSKIKVPLPDLMSAVLSLDDSALDVDQVDNLIKFCPTKEEMKLLKNYNGNKENLGKCEQFFFELMKVPRVESKLRVFSFKIQFRTQVSDLRNNLSTINSASEEVRNSVKLKRIMRTILSLGNALNHGTARGSAVGFRLDSLLKLTETRARNNKMTLMHYLCKVLAEKLPELLDFPKDLVSLEAVTKIQLKYLAEEMQAISKGLEKVEQEFTASENDGKVSENFCKILKEFLSFTEGEVRSLASLYSGVGRNADALAQYFGEDPTWCPFEQVVSTLLNFVRMFVRAHEENCKQLELEKKKAQKETESEKLKMSSAKKDSLHSENSPLERNIIK